MSALKIMIGSSEYELPADLVESIEQYLDTQREPREHPVTKAPVMQPRYAEPAIENFIIDQLGSLFASIVAQFPTASQIEVIQQRQQLEAQMREAARPQKVEGR